MTARDALASLRADVALAPTGPFDDATDARACAEASDRVVDVHAPAMLRALEVVEKLVRYDECHHTVVDEDGYEGPCDRIAFALRIDPEGGPYPVCIEHAKDGPLFALGQIRDLIENKLEGR